jgi:hypothetical protein
VHSIEFTAACRVSRKGAVGFGGGNDDSVLVGGFESDVDGHWNWRWAEHSDIVTKKMTRKEESGFIIGWML